MESIVTKFVMFSLNYPIGFIKEVEWTCSTEHMQGKFNSYYDRHGRVGAMTNFWAELSTANRNRLAEYINKIEL